MDYQPNNENLAKAGKSLPKTTTRVIENLLKEGKTCEETAKLAEVRKQTVVDIRKQMEQEGKMELGSWKKEVSNLLGEFALKGAKRLVDEIDTMPIGQVTMAVAIAVDKVSQLTDAPTVKVEARLKISQDDLNKAFGLNAKPIEIIDIPPKNPLDENQE
jgi:DNA-binding XRE family transcriptional regulator